MKYPFPIIYTCITAQDTGSFFWGIDILGGRGAQYDYSFSAEHLFSSAIFFYFGVLSL